jgi:hypothetical protein
VTIKKRSRSIAASAALGAFEREVSAPGGRSALRASKAMARGAIDA